VAWRIRRKPIRNRAHDDAYRQADEPCSDVHDTRFPDGGCLPAGASTGRLWDPSCG
jgi:hypothetical protein